jgi:hypothetical protein
VIFNCTQWVNSECIKLTRPVFGARIQFNQFRRRCAEQIEILQIPAAVSSIPAGIFYDSFGAGLHSEAGRESRVDSKSPVAILESLPLRVVCSIRQIHNQLHYQIDLQEAWPNFSPISERADWNQLADASNPSGLLLATA